MWSIMSIAAALIYWVIVAVWLIVLATIVVFYIRNPRAFGTTRLLLAVIGIDTIRNIVENVYFGLYFGGQYGLFSSEISKLLGNPYLLIVPKLINVAAGCLVLGLLLHRASRVACVARQIQVELAFLFLLCSNPLLRW